MMTDIARVSKKEEQAYFKEAKSWDSDRINELKKSRRLAWYVAGSAVAVAVMLSGALLTLIPLHTIEPYVVRVDSSTGIVDQVVKIRDARSSYDEVMSKYFLRRLVTLRETYTRAQLESNYKQAMLFTAPKARAELKQAFSFENPNGPYKRYGELGTAKLQFKNISFISPNVAQVRYVRIDQKSGAETASHWVATIEFRYVSQPASEEARGINPLGFQVTNYRNDPEAIIEQAKPVDLWSPTDRAQPNVPSQPIVAPPQPVVVPAPLEAPQPITRSSQP